MTIISGQCPPSDQWRNMGPGQRPGHAAQGEEKNITNFFQMLQKYSVNKNNLLNMFPTMVFILFTLPKPISEFKADLHHFLKLSFTPYLIRKRLTAPFLLMLLEITGCFELFVAKFTLHI